MSSVLFAVMSACQCDFCNGLCVCVCVCVCVYVCVVFVHALKRMRLRAFQRVFMRRRCVYMCKCVDFAMTVLTC